MRLFSSTNQCLPGAVASYVCLLITVIVALLLPVAARSLLSQYPKFPPEIIRAPDANQQSDINQQQAAKQNYDAANAERKKQIADESAKLLKLANELKTEVDKTNKDMLSLNVIRKAEAIEKLAHDVKEKMKLSVGAS